MAIIRHLTDKKMGKTVLRPKIPVKEKWEKISGNAARKLNEKTAHWQRLQQQYFLLTFCLFFLALLSVSFLFTIGPKQEQAVKAVELSRHILPEKQISKVLPPPAPGKIPPPLPPDSADKKSIHSH